MMDPSGDFNAIVDAAPIGVLVVSDKGRLMYVNPALEAMFGYHHRDLLGREVEFLLPKHLRERHQDFRAIFFQNPQPRTMGSGRELFALHAHGHEFPIEIGLGTISQGGARCAVAFVSDISQRKRLEQKFSKVVASLPVGLVMVNHEGKITMTNSALDTMFGYDTEALIGEAIEVLLPDRVRQRHPELRGAFARAPEVRVMGSGRDLMAKHRDGREFPVEVGLTPLDHSDGKHVLAAVTDISLRKRFEDTLTQTNAQLEEFSYIASHDLRSPLRGIAELLSWIREDLDETQLSENIRKNFDRAQVRIERAERMIEDLLEYARAGKQEDRIETVDPRQLIEDILTLVEVPAGFKVEVDVPALTFRTTRTPLSLALRNIIANAFKHHGGTEGLVRISMREDGRFNVFTVEDDGQGIPPDADERIFKLFHRANSSTVGHGVGLAVTRRMVNSNGGIVVLDRMSDLPGACFKVHWPRFQLKKAD